MIDIKLKFVPGGAIVIRDITCPGHTDCNHEHDDEPSVVNASTFTPEAAMVDVVVHSEKKDVLIALELAYGELQLPPFEHIPMRYQDKDSTLQEFAEDLFKMHVGLTSTPIISTPEQIKFLETILDDTDNYCEYMKDWHNE